MKHMTDTEMFNLRPEPKEKMHFKPIEPKERKDMSNITLYMDTITQNKLRALAKKQDRSISKQVKHMINFYIQTNEIDEKDLM